MAGSQLAISSGSERPTRGNGNSPTLPPRFTIFTSSYSVGHKYFMMRRRSRGHLNGVHSTITGHGTLHEHGEHEHCTGDDKSAEASKHFVVGGVAAVAPVEELNWSRDSDGLDARSRESRAFIVLSHKSVERRQQHHPHSDDTHAMFKILLLLLVVIRSRIPTVGSPSLNPHSNQVVGPLDQKDTRGVFVSGDL